MDEPASAPQSGEPIKLLQSVSARLRRGETVPRLEVEPELERGFGVLMSLEAELQRLTRQPPVVVGRRAAADRDELQAAIAALREALSEVRSAYCAHTSVKAGYGFVLPVGSRRRSGRSQTARPRS